MNKRFYLVICIWAVFMAPLNADAADFLNDISIKNAGTHNSFVPFISDSFSVFTNPAGLGKTPRSEFRLLYHSLFEGGSLSALAYAHPIMDKGTFAVSAVIANSGDIEEIDEYNSTTGIFSDSSRTIMLSYGIQPVDFIRFGVNLKYLNRIIYNSNTSAYGADTGIIYNAPYNIHISLFLKNIIKPEFIYESGASDKIPFYYSLALGCNFTLFENIKDDIRVSVNASKNEFSENYNLSAGAEYTFLENYSVRGGAGSGGFSGGLSIRFSHGEINYAFVRKPFDFLHRFSISYRFGDNIRALESKLRTEKEKIKNRLITEIKDETLGNFKKDILALESDRKYKEALETLDKALAWDPGGSWFLKKQAELEKLRKNKELKILFSEAEELMAGEFYIDALVKLKNILDMDPGNKQAWTRFREAQGILKKLGENNLAAEKRNREKIRTHFEKGLEHYTSGEFDKAIDAWGKVIKESPMQRQVYGYIEKAQSRIKKKEDVKTRKKTEKEQKKTSLYNRAVLLYTQGRFEESLNVWRELLRLQPDNAEAKEYIKKITEDFRKMQQQQLRW
ncbi:MAG: tetratricopeptide repeat protein [Candidatus Goldiibacteriota bacterium]